MASVKIGRWEAENIELPPVCMRCGEPAETSVKKTFAWHPGWVAITILAGLVIYVVLAVVLTKKMRLRVPLCQKHRHHWLVRSLFVIGGLFAIIAGIICWAATSANNQPPVGRVIPEEYFVIGVIFAALVWLIIAVVLHTNAIRPIEITERMMTLINVAPAFRAALEQARTASTLKPASE